MPFKKDILKKCGMAVIILGIFLLVLSFILLCRNIYKDLYSDKQPQKLILDIDTADTNENSDIQMMTPSDIDLNQNKKADC